MSLRFETDNKEDAFAIRQEVFVEEQGFAEEFDDIDDRATHLVLYDNDRAIGCARLFPKREGSTTYITGRFALLPQARGTGLGSSLVTEAEAIAVQRGAREVHLHAQCRVVPFYEKLGYQAYGPIEPEEHVDHIWMKKIIG